MLTFTNFTVTVPFADFSAENWEALVRDSTNPKNTSWDEVEMCKEAKLQAGIKPTALCSAIDKENSIEFLLDSVHYLYKQSNPNPVLLSRASL